MKSEKEIFDNYLIKKNLRETPQRGLILDTFLKHEEHISAEQLYDIVKKRDPSLGQATVYRVLKLIVEAGLAREVDLGDGVMRYEHNYNHPHHDHLVCRGCGKTIEVFDSVIEELQKRVAESYGFELTDHEMYLYGFCENCRKRKQ
ncbi:Fur family transcriptional regulator [Smithella sp. F21]|jgi:Fur family ferric uptake transcriptional regulator|nr:Fur family transcriptional regulator [Smithella sp. F21]HBJ74922.1 transcriptional repressor [Syntrophaceae bacterium]HCS77451.1 transcriptional repressor [Syntrophaceae bacterium]